MVGSHLAGGKIDILRQDKSVVGHVNCNLEWLARYLVRGKIDIMRQDKLVVGHVIDKCLP